MKKAFRTCDNKGFQITFPNGVMLSTQFGWGNYCENRNTKMHDFNLSRPDTHSNDCEIAIIDVNGKWITTEFKDKGNDVLGWINIKDWMKAFDFCRNYKRPKSKKQAGRE